MKYPNVTAGQVEACINRMGGWDNFLLYIGGKGKVLFNKPLTFIGHSILPAEPATQLSFQLVVNDLRLCMGDDYRRGSNIFTQFFSLLSPAADAVEIAVHRLEEEMEVSKVLEILAGKAELNPLQFFKFVQANKESRKEFVAFLRGSDGNLWRVSTPVGSYGGHGVRADRIERFSEIPQGVYVVSLT